MGKTLMVIAAANAMYGETGGVIVIVCPAGLRDQWRSNLAQWCSPAVRCSVVSYGDLTTTRVAFLPEQIDVLVLDEAHYVKEPKAQRTKALYGQFCRGGGFADRARFTWLLTGTPMPNHPGEVWPMLRRFDSECIHSATGRPMSYGDFLDHYCATVTTGTGRKIVGGRRLGKLHQVMAKHTLVQDYTLLPKVPLPPKPELVMVDIDKKEVAKIEEFSRSPEGRAVRLALATGGVSALKKLGTNGATLRRLLGFAKVGPVVQMVQGELEADPSLKIIVFAFHQEVVAALKARLVKFGAVAFVGGMTPKEQAKIKASLAHDPKCRVVVASLIAAAEGHDFSAADMSIRAESAWVPSQNDQADRRIFNLNKHRPITVRALALRKSIDEDVMRALEGKANITRVVFGSG